MLFTSESVTEGHPDKVADQISDAILDACLAQDKGSRVACEALLKGNLIVVAGEITTKADFDPQEIVKKVLTQIGYDPDRYEIMVKLSKQSPDIAQGVDRQTEDQVEKVGAGDQGMMIGYATNETPEFMPLPITLAHKLTKRLSEVRKSKEIPCLLPDGKAQVTVEYNSLKPKRITSVILSSHHQEVDFEKMKKQLKNLVIDQVLPSEMIDQDTKVFINPAGPFLIGGPEADAGLTGRKIIVDTYGGWARHGGGAFSGKDATKVDRSGAYYARYVAKNLVAAGLADKLEIQVAYAIGVSKPVGIMVEDYDTAKVPIEQIKNTIQGKFDFRPGAIINNLDLQKPIYLPTAAYGHFGRLDLDLPWERLDLVNK